MTILVCGSRTWTDVSAISHTIYEYTVHHADLGIIHGGARGVDTIADNVAHELGIPIRVYPAQWDQYGKSAGYRRNVMLDEKPDLVLAFWDGVSKRTARTITEAHKRGIPVRIIGQEDIPPRRRLTRSSVGGTS